MESRHIEEVSIKNTCIVSYIIFVLFASTGVVYSAGFANPENIDLTKPQTQKTLYINNGESKGYYRVSVYKYGKNQSRQKILIESGLTKALKKNKKDNYRKYWLNAAALGDAELSAYVLDLRLVKTKKNRAALFLDVGIRALPGISINAKYLLHPKKPPKIVKF